MHTCSAFPYRFPSGTVPRSCEGEAQTMQMFPPPLTTSREARQVTISQPATVVSQTWLAPLTHHSRLAPVGGATVFCSPCLFGSADTSPASSPISTSCHVSLEDRLPLSRWNTAFAFLSFFFFSAPTLPSSSPCTRARRYRGM